MELIASALELAPCFFLEYRTESIRRFFDQDRVAPEDLAARTDALDAYLHGREPRTPALTPLIHQLTCDPDQSTPAVAFLQELADTDRESR